MLEAAGNRDASAAASEGLVTADMVAQHAYCPRRLHLMYAESRWADNAHTEQGRWVHRNADRRDDALPAAEDAEAPRVARSVSLESARLGLRAKLDLLELDAGRAVPVEIKKAELPSSGEPYPPERNQLAVQVLLLREHGTPCEAGVLYYAASKRRVEVTVDGALEAEVLARVGEVRRVLALNMSPSPLVDSPKCPGCSLVGICLPDETQLLEARGSHMGDDEKPVRRLVPPRDDALPLYVQEQGATVGKRGETLVVTKRGEPLAEARLIDVSQLVLCGNISVTPAALHLLCEAGAPIVHLSIGHWFYGITAGITLRNAFDRAAQYACAADPERRLPIARAIVVAKARNQRTLLRRNGPSEAPVLDELKRAIADIDDASSDEALLGAEGRVAALYFGAFSTMLRPRPGGLDEAQLAFAFDKRTRRPPRDPVNALLSFGYALLAKDAAVALLSVGLDPYWGIFHKPRHGRPSLALDLMEELRPLVVDSAVISAVNTGVVDPGSFASGANGCALNARGRKAFLGAYEARMDQLVTHPVFGYRVSWRRVLSVQAQLLARVLRGELVAYPGITTR
jgi:CRISPR-associated endonuclease Cas1/CRISPR-associated protein Cas4